MTAWVATTYQYAIVVSGALEGSAAVGRSESESLPDGNYRLSPGVPAEVSIEHQ